MKGNVVSVERTIAAPPEKIFDLLADPAKHSEIDGSGTVKRVRGSTGRLSKGADFGMSMHMGVPYSMVNTVVEFEDNRRIAWQPHMAGPMGRLVGGRIWRYELEPVAGGTLVKESWDIRQESPVTRPIVRRAAATTRKNMARTLERIEAVLTKQAQTA